MNKQKIKDVLVAVDKRFKDSRYWDQGYWAKDAWKNPVEFDAYDACCWCLAGAIHKETGKDIGLYRATTDYLGKRLVRTRREDHNDGESYESVVIYWQDSKEITFTDIKEFLAESIDELGA